MQGTLLCLRNCQMLLKKTDELAKNLKTSIDHLQSLEIECQ